MQTGTLSEKRTTTKPINPDYAVPEGNQPILKTMMVPEQETKENKAPNKEPVEKPQLTTTAQPQVWVKPKPQPEHVTDTKCLYCKAEAITTLAIRGGLVLVLLALCFNLIKSASK